MRRFVHHAAIGTAALVLAGCSAIHTGDGWQCPLAQGSVCTNVAEADPALQAAPPPEFAIRAPLHRERATAMGTGTEIRNRDSETVTSPCSEACNPFAWLARLFGGEAEPSEAAAIESATVDGAGPETDPEPMDVAGSATDKAVKETATDDAIPADPSRSSQFSDDGNPFDRLRVPETVARIWIAPFVDDGNVWHEGHWVHAVIAPARWRQP